MQTTKHVNYISIIGLFKIKHVKYVPKPARLVTMIKLKISHYAIVVLNRKHFSMVYVTNADYFV